MAKKKAPTSPKPDELNERRERFCRFYAQNDELFGNGTLSYAEAYDYGLDELPTDDAEYDDDGKVIEVSSYDKAYRVCSVEAVRLLRNPSVQARIVELRNELLKDDVVDSELVKVIKQDRKLEPKVAAIKEFNKLRGRIIDRSTLEIEERFAVDDIRTILSVLPQERQDEVYGIISAAIADAELLRSSQAGKGGNTQ